MFGPDEILWGGPPGPGPALGNALEKETNRANHSWPGLSFFKAILRAFFVLLLVFIIGNFASPRTLREFSYGPHPIVLPAKQRHPRRIPLSRPRGVRRRTTPSEPAPSGLVNAAPYERRAVQCFPSPTSDRSESPPSTPDPQ
jgi:hypothetical protein